MRKRLAVSTVKRRVACAIREFLRADGALLVRNVAEPDVAHKFAAFLTTEFPGRHVDVNYNRHGLDIKRLRLPAPCGNWRTPYRRVFPDVVVHCRGTDDANLLVVEIKKSTNHEPRDCDAVKLRGFRQQLRYQYGLFLEFQAGNARPRVLRKVWYAAPMGHRVESGPSELREP